MDKYKKNKQQNTFTSEFSTFPFPTSWRTYWFPLGGARGQHKHQYKINSWIS